MPSIPTFVGDDIKYYFIIVKPNLERNLVLLGIIGFTISLMCGDIST